MQLTTSENQDISKFFDLLLKQIVIENRFTGNDNYPLVELLTSWELLLHQYNWYDPTGCY